MADLNEYRVYIIFRFELENNAVESFVILKVTLGSEPTKIAPSRWGFALAGESGARTHTSAIDSLGR
jgi:hypothetical protein